MFSDIVLLVFTHALADYPARWTIVDIFKHLFFGEQGKIPVDTMFQNPAGQGEINDFPGFMAVGERIYQSGRERISASNSVYDHG